MLDYDVLNTVGPSLSSKLRKKFQELIHQKGWLILAHPVARVIVYRTIYRYHNVQTESYLLNEAMVEFLW